MCSPLMISLLSILWHGFPCIELAASVYRARCVAVGSSRIRATHAVLPVFPRFEDCMLAIKGSAGLFSCRVRAFQKLRFTVARRRFESPSAFEPVAQLVRNEKNHHGVDNLSSSWRLSR